MAPWEADRACISVLRRAAAVSYTHLSGLLVDLTDAVENGQNYEKDANWGETLNPTLLSNCKATLKAIGSDYADKLYGVPFTCLLYTSRCV